ncbi:hypothetical protein N7462_010680 [Penicillium macrosclerotiorum]|uniref:uncharacterized protein n=1 Tax=Penicillium macrosclerotiorum TaxID=303699 RepID=UPI002549BAA3|nr:uncharacterized protein N7462_010680 [Penicillium macrosclerotiorum]KAJ5669610.1 hypothetical protein N7462_010680 [Penicillium macrosclerotiorum]
MQLKVRQRRSLIRKILRMFHVPSLQSKSSSIITLTNKKQVSVASDFKNDNFKSQGHNDNIFTTEYVDMSPRYSSDTSPVRIAPSRRELEERIVQLWKKVWFGLYEIEDSEQRLHISRLQALYFGAGFTAYLGRLEILRRQSYRGISANEGILSLKVFDGLSVATLESVLEILRAYENEIPNLDRLYAILRRGQRPIHRSKLPAPTEGLRREYLAVAEPMEKRIKQYDIWMNVLNHDIRDEAMIMSDLNSRPRGGFVYYMAFPGR